MLDLQRSDAQCDPSLRHYDSLSLALKVLDLIIETTGLDREIDSGTATRALIPLMAQMDRAEGIEPDSSRCILMAERLLAALRNDAKSRHPFEVDYTDFEVDCALRRTLELEAAARGVRILKSVETRSKLPASLRELGERSFLKITLHPPTDPAEMRSRIEELLNDIVKSGTVPTGIELVQQAVRRLARPIQIRMLFPDPDSAPQYDPITAMTRLSGGEQLTSAILLYCTLAQLRARERGRQMDGSSTLFLDNPIGKASRSKFLELQREVARAMNIQLIYTTGVNDFEAIRMFPNIIRLRNDRGDRSTGERFLEIEANDGYLQEARLMLTDNQPLVDSVE